MTRPCLPTLLLGTAGACCLAWASSSAAATLQPPMPRELDCIINPSEVADLGSGTAGIIQRVQAERGDFIEKDEVVAELESGVEQATVELASVRAELTTEIELRQVGADYNERRQNRNADLFQKRAISAHDIDERQTETQVAKLQLRQAVDNQRLAKLELRRAEEQLKRRTIRSPLKGVVMERFKSIGEYVEDQPVLRVAQLDPLHIEVIAPVELLGKIEQGMQAQIHVDATGDTTYRASVARVDRVADAASGTFGVRFVLPNPEYRIPAGLRCRLQLLSDTTDAAPVGRSPSYSIVVSGGRRALVRSDEDRLRASGRGGRGRALISGRPRRWRRRRRPIEA